MFVSVDTVSIDEDKNEAEAMKELLDRELAIAREDEWKIVFGHYPCHSGGGHGGYQSMREQILPTMNAHNVDFYLAGHDHNLQHWGTRGSPADIDHIITGKASLYLPKTYPLQELGEHMRTEKMRSKWMKTRRWGWN